MVLQMVEQTEAIARQRLQMTISNKKDRTGLISIFPQPEDALSVYCTCSQHGQI